MTVLSGIRVLDFSRYIAGPYCASILADLGADVIRIEPVAGGEDRLLVPVTEEGQGALFLQMNRNKRSLAIDMASKEVQPVLSRLIATADVVVTNMPVDALKRQGLDRERLIAVRPDIITTNLSAFGQSEALRAKTGFDAVAQAISGAAYLGGSEEAPSRAASSYVDYGTGLAGAMGTLAALIERMKSGKGQDVQASLLATAMTFINAAHIEAAAKGADRQPWGNRSPFSGPSDFFATLDGFIAVQVVGNVMFQRWARLIGRPELVGDPRFASDSMRGLNGEQLSVFMRGWCEGKSTDEALALLARAGIPAGPVYSPRESLTAPDIAASGVLQPTEVAGAPAPLPLAELLVRFGDSATGIRSAAPMVGEHSVAILESLGLSAQEIAVLVARHLVGAPERRGAARAAAAASSQ